MGEGLITNRRSVASLLTSCPQAGQGVHNWTWHATLALRDILSPDEIIRLLTVATRDCGRVCTRDIQDAVAKLNGDFDQIRPGEQRRSQTGRIKPRSHLRKIEINDALRRKIVEQGHTVTQLKEFSPTKLPSDQREIVQFVLDRLFPDDPLLCVAKAIDDHVTLRRHELTKPYIYSHIVPNPMSKVWGLNQNGEKSQRCLDNTGSRTYLVVEFDLTSEADGSDSTDAKFVQWASERGITIHDVSVALLLHLAKAASLVAVVDSGNKSLHGWFNVQDWDERDTVRFMSLAVRLGSDPATYTKCQLVRMPGGVRCDKEGELVCFQDIVYFDESKCVKPALKT